MLGKRPSAIFSPRGEKPARLRVRFRHAAHFHVRHAVFHAERKVFLQAVQRNAKAFYQCFPLLPRPAAWQALVKHARFQRAGFRVQHQQLRQPALALVGIERPRRKAARAREHRIHARVHVPGEPREHISAAQEVRKIRAGIRVDVRIRLMGHENQGKRRIDFLHARPLPQRDSRRRSSN